MQCERHLLLCWSLAKINKNPEGGLNWLPSGFFVCILVKTFKVILMNFKEWYDNCVRNNNQFESCMPNILVLSKEHYKQVVSELTRLGFGCGNDFSKYATPEVPVTFVDIWYDDFYNSHLAPYKNDDGDFLVTLEELVATEAREEFVRGMT